MFKIKLILVIGFLSLVLLSSFIGSHLPYECNDHSISIDSTSNIQLQHLLNEYTEAKLILETAKSRIQDLSRQIEARKSELAIVKNSILLYKSERDSIKYLEFTDSVMSLADSLKWILEGNQNKRFLVLDTVIKKSETKVNSLSKSNAQAIQLLDSLKTDRDNRQIQVETILKKLRLHAGRLRGGFAFKLFGVMYNMYIANLDSEQIRMHLFNHGKQKYYSLGAVKERLLNDKLEPLMITNGGMYTKSNEPVGLYIESGSNISYRLDTSKRVSDENFYLYPNGVFYIDSNNIAHINTTDYFFKLQQEGKVNPISATQSGPMLVIDGKLHDKFSPGSQNEKIRSGVGLVNKKTVVFLITLDESNFYNFATVFKDIFSCKDALFLDGAISQMYLKNINPVVGGNFGPIISVTKKY